VKAILQVKPELDPDIVSEKMNWWVDAKGQQVQPGDKGEFREGSIPYAVFAARNTEVSKAYGKLNPGPDLKLL
jgi:hypothetical protein